MIFKCIVSRILKLNIYLLLIFISTLIYKSSYLLKIDDHFSTNETFVFSAYQISNDTVRVLYLKDAWLKNTNLYYRFRISDKMQKAESICQRSKCPTFHDPFCTLNGYLAILQIPFIYQHSFLETVELSISTELPLKTIQIPLTDTRPKIPPKHFLGICLQPIFYLFSPKSIISFFEYWISQEATIFYIYQNSWSSEVAKVLEFYSKHPKITVKLIDWSDLPHQSGSNLNPNKFFRRFEFSLAAADCVYRSRRETQFLAMTDLDEIIYIKSDQTAKEFIQVKTAAISKKNISSFWFSSAKIIGKCNKTQIWKVLDKSIQSKLIINSHLTKTINIHEAGEAEDPTRDQIVDIHPNEALIVHSRFDYETANESLNSNILSMKGLSKFQNYLEFHIEKIFQMLKIPKDKHEKLQQQIFKDFDECAAVYKGKPFCKSIHSCKTFLKDSEFIESNLIKASSSWRIL